MANPFPDIAENDLAYIAGFLDGEGTISIIRVKRKDRVRTYKNPYFRPIVVINNTNREVLEWIAAVFGVGKIDIAHKQTDKRKTCYRWIVGNRVAINIARALHPYLRIKRLQAEILFEYEEASTSDVNPYGSLGIPSNIIDTRNSLVDRLRVENQRGS